MDIGRRLARRGIVTHAQRVFSGSWWQSTRGAYDRARELGQNACRAAQVQWLDESVQVTGLRLRRDPADGWLKLERRYRFEYSGDGNDRHSGHLVLLGTRLTEFAGPTRPEPVVEFGTH